MDKDGVGEKLLKARYTEFAKAWNQWRKKMVRTEVLVAYRETHLEEFPAYVAERSYALLKGRHDK